MPSILSEIDAIFATKPSKVLINSTTKKVEEKTKKRKNEDPKGNEVIKSGTEEKKKKKKKKTKTSIKDIGSKEEDDEEDLGEVEEIIDPSINILEISNQAGGIDSKTSGSSSKKVLLDDDELAFRDSRGTRAKTEDGLPIYSVEELKIGLGGDTEACPFDCECCF